MISLAVNEDNPKGDICTSAMLMMHSFTVSLKGRAVGIVVVLKSFDSVNVIQAGRPKA